MEEFEEVVHAHWIEKIHNIRKIDSSCGARMDENTMMSVT